MQQREETTYPKYKEKVVFCTLAKTFSWKIRTQYSLCYMKQILEKITRNKGKNRKNSSQFSEKKKSQKKENSDSDSELRVAVAMSNMAYLKDRDGI